MNAEKKNTLLIVDDEKMNLKVLTHILGSEYEILTAADGESAVEKAKKYLPDLILLDIIMPEVDGYQTITDIKNCEETSKIPIIIISSLSSIENEERGLSLDAVDYIAKPFSDQIVKLRVRNQIQIINQMRTIELLGMLDPLTNIPNRRSFDYRIEMEWKQAIREKTPISILMMDLDRFKELNDTYGHQEGDIVLKTVADTFPRAFRRSGDFVARWGGEEFVVLLPNTPLPGAIEVAENIRSDVEKLVMKGTSGDELKTTISIGINSGIPEKGALVQDFILMADKALYAAKQSGRNRVCKFN